MIDVKESSKKALEYLVSFYPRSTGYQLEEVELGDDKKYWFITLSYDDQSLSDNFHLEPRKYKIFKIDSETGEVISMKIRDIR